MYKLELNAEITTVQKRVKATLLVISTNDPSRRKRLEEQIGISMLEMDEKFLEDQKGKRIGYCGEL